VSERDGSPLRVLVVDDEPLARAFVRDVLEEMPEVRVVDECGDGREAAARIREDAPDLVLLDVQMPEVDGFDLIESVGPDAMPEVVFVTAHEQYTLRAFEVHALDYVLKPFDPDRLRAAVEHARDRIAAGGSEALDERLGDLLAELSQGAGRAAGAPRYARRLTVRKGDRIRFVPLADVDWLEAARNYVRLHAGDDRWLVRSSLKALLERLDPSRFVRVHRSAVVNLDRVVEVQPWMGGDYVAILETGERLRVSRTYRDALLDLIH
jgi:two-component system LytT family response regulator